MPNNLRHDLDHATPEEQAIHLAYSRENLEVDLEGYATEQWVLSKKYLTKKDLPEQNVGGGGAPEDHDHDYLPLSGGTLTGTLTGKLLKSTRDTGYAFEVKPDNTTTKAFLHTDGHASFSGRVDVDGTKVSLEDHTHPDYASDIADLQEGFDEAVLAAQEGAENIEVELQSYSKKTHTHDYAPKSHTHDYAPKSHTHDYAAKDHNHSGTYVRGGFQITKANGCFYIQ